MTSRFGPVNRWCWPRAMHRREPPYPSSK